MNKTALVGAAAIAAIALAGVAVAEIRNSHVLTLRLPDGSLEQIRYVGDTPPVVRLQPGWAPVAAFAEDDAFALESPFAALERISAQMDREAAALLQQAHTLPDLPTDGPSGVMRVDLGKLPPGVSGYSTVTTMAGGRVCTRTIQYGPADGSGRAKAVSRVSGDCDAPAEPSATQTAQGPDTAAPARLQTVSARF